MRPNAESQNDIVWIFQGNNVVFAISKDRLFEDEEVYLYHLTLTGTELPEGLMPDLSTKARITSEGVTASKSKTCTSKIVPPKTRKNETRSAR